ncbi:MAG TPA: FapA family protein [Acetivibrio sp.]|uniref:FapA family protein n=1 Tax=Acetivibrio sp. TaxID=1872092 RepID=UPI002BA85F03|nr:FapA family protein [Acetivibrio sp.]HOM02084.1 FapA family protein [Acetivibrio sp.]
MSDSRRGSSYGSPNDGFFEIQYNENGVYLKVHPPIGKGKAVEVNDVISRLAQKKVIYDKEMVEFAVQKAVSAPVKIGEPQEELKLDATIDVNISHDKMKATMVIKPPDGGRMLTKDEMMEILKSNGVKYGINESTLENVSKYPVYNEVIIIAEGTPPTNGQNGRVEFHFDLNKERKPTVLEDGRVDFRELNLIESVRKGQVLCTLVPPLPGTPGRTVEDTEVPALDGKPAVLPKGKHVEITEDGQNLIAGIDGQVNLIDGKVSVFANYEVPADVDNSTGNISFVGNVIIRGNVLSGFTVEAGGNVEVMGVVEAAVIKADGDIILRRGMQGLGKGILKSGGDIIAKYIENSIIEAKGDIKAEAIMHSNVKCGNKLELSGKKGLLIGGKCKVGKEVSAKVIGSYLATHTDVEVGIDPQIKERYKEIRDEIHKIEEDLVKAEQAITILKKIEAAGKMTPEKQELMARSIRTKIYYSNRLNELKEELAITEQRLQKEADGKIRVFDHIYPGTKVSIGTSMMYVKEDLQYCTLYRDGSDIRVGPIDK